MNCYDSMVVILSVSCSQVGVILGQTRRETKEARTKCGRGSRRRSSLFADAAMYIAFVFERRSAVVVTLEASGQQYFCNYSGNWKRIWPCNGQSS